jgi:diguanylate cyclase (GGDEF)-like protein
MIAAYWRLVLGPSLTIAACAALLLLARSGVQVPVPGAFVLGTVFVASYVGGAPSGYLSAVIGIGFGLLVLPDNEVLMSSAPDRFARFVLLVAFALALPTLVGRSQARATERFEQERANRQRVEAANRELLVLRADLVRQAEELQRLATTDDLTGLYNRRHFLTLAEDERRRHDSMGQPLALLILDIDLFKSINDRFGHTVGDAVICRVADICREEISAHDILARIGGEEFVLLLPNTTGQQAFALAERVRLRLATAPLVVDGADTWVTVSIGISEAGVRSECVGELMKRADQALYRAKHEGRNRVRLAHATPPISDEPYLPPAAAA